MEKGKIKRLYELRQQKSKLDLEIKALSKEIKAEMLRENQDKIEVDGYEVFIKLRTRITVDKSVLDFLEELGYGDRAEQYYTENHVTYLYINDSINKRKF